MTFNLLVSVGLFVNRVHQVHNTYFTYICMTRGSLSWPICQLVRGRNEVWSLLFDVIFPRSPSIIRVVSICMSVCSIGAVPPLSLPLTVQRYLAYYPIPSLPDFARVWNSLCLHFWASSERLLRLFLSLLLSSIFSFSVRQSWHAFWPVL